ncbi:MAG: Hsp70 family protein [Opitutae bacterium]|jgi:molecular chaperone DnaK|nr:Hsp70 family protein [Opitutae bacterium]
MKRTNIDYGIDLGTTNSAIARMESGNVKIIKSDGYQKDTTPSCVAVNRSGSIMVGDDAYRELERAKNKRGQNPQATVSDTFSEFKRLMGTDQVQQSVHLDCSLTPEDLSAEVLKKLKSYVKDEDSIPAVIITVPAKFTNPQNEATRIAAKNAGFEYCELVQEPIAASVAYGLSGKDIEGKWLAFDFGGGTFDAALMHVEEGILSVKDTEGDNLLGGKNLDEAIVNEILYPYICQNFPMHRKTSDDEGATLLKNALKRTAENVKIAFSNKDCPTVKVYHEELGDDDEGNEIILDVEIPFSYYEQVVGPWFDKSIAIASNLVRRNGMQSTDLQKVILVGGPTLSHLLREKISNTFSNAEIDTSIDPMTAVAVGAAIFASTKKIPSDFQQIDRAKAQLDIECADTSVEDEEPVAIVLKREGTEGELPEKIYVEMANEDGSWQGPRSEMQNDADVVMVNLNPGKQNVFSISLFDEVGNRIQCEPGSISILQGMKIGNPPMAYSLGIAVANTDKDSVFKTIPGLERKAVLPAKGKLLLGTTKDINPADDDNLTFEFLQGEEDDKDGTRTEAFETLAKITIEADDIPGYMPKGSEVELLIRVDESTNITGEAFLTSFDETIEFKQIRTKKQILSSEEIRQRISKAKTRVTIGDDLPDTAEDILDELNNVEANLDQQDNEDQRERAKGSLKKIWAKIDYLEDEAEWPRAEDELDRALNGLVELEGDYGGNDHALSNEFEKQVGQIKEIKDTKLATQLASEIRLASFSYLREQPGFWVHMIEQAHQQFDEIEWKNSTQAKMAVDNARNAIRTNPDLGNLMENYQEILQHMQDPSVMATPGGADVTAL